VGEKGVDREDPETACMSSSGYLIPRPTANDNRKEEETIVDTEERMSQSPDILGLRTHKGGAGTTSLEVGVSRCETETTGGGGSSIGGVMQDH